MPAVRNRTKQELNLGVVGLVIGPEEVLELEQPDFDALRGHPLLEPVTPASDNEGEGESE